jgi:hypothetical protein
VDPQLILFRRVTASGRDLQAAGDPARAAQFFERDGYRRDEGREVAATKVRGALNYR